MSDVPEPSSADYYNEIRFYDEKERVKDIFREEYDYLFEEIEQLEDKYKVVVSKQRKSDVIEFILENDELDYVDWDYSEKMFVIDVYFNVN